MIPGSINALLLGEEAGAAGGYSISRSLRFNSSDSAYLSRTPASAGNRKTWTWAGWVKFSAVAEAYGIFEAPFQSGGAGVLSDVFEIWYSSGTIHLTDYGTYYFISAAKFRDPSAWQHFVFTCDTTQATASNRFKVYQNGVQLVNTASATITQNLDTAINNTAPHRIASWRGISANAYFADIHFIDGQALDPTSFGEFSATTGVWMPKAYTGTYGTNGFKLNFSDNSTAAALGTDVSGLGNTWTVNNLSVTAGAGNDSLVDVPTNGTETDTGVGGEVRGNYATWNPLDRGPSYTLSNGNLDASTSGAAWTSVRATVGVSSGKYYWEITPTTSLSSSNTVLFGIGDPSMPLTTYIGAFSSGKGYYAFDGNKYPEATSYGATYTANDVIGIALNMDAGTLTFYKNGVSQGQSHSGLSGTWFPAISLYGTVTVVANFGQRPFAYNAPSGYKALCTANLPAPVITKPSTVMDVALWTGNGSTQSITTDFSPDFVWIKSRSASGSHNLFDAVRGATNLLETQNTDPETTNATTTLTSFNSNGFSLSSSTRVNGNGTTYAGWAWDAGSSTVTNTQGSITSSVRANPSAGFSVVSYTGISGYTSNINPGTVGHGLNAEPFMLIVKNRDVSGEAWQVYHKSLGNDKNLILNSTGAVGGPSNEWWNSTTPTSTVFSVRNSGAVNGLNQKIIAYCFAPVAGYSSFGSYTGNGSTDGPFVYTGFRPRWILYKNSSQASDWAVYDAVRSSYNVVNDYLTPNTSAAEGVDYTNGNFDILSNGFKIRATWIGQNGSGNTIIYAAFAESPFQYARAR